MFTGIVEDLGEVEAVEHLGDFARIQIRSAAVTQDARPGDSIAVNGVCLTVTALIAGPPGDTPPPVPGEPGHGSPPQGFTADVMGETLARTSLAGVAPGTRVNLERSVRVSDRLGGHIMQGHVDGTAAIISRTPSEHWEVVRISLPADLARYVVHKGSVAVDGVSLTVSGIAAAGGTTPPYPPDKEQGDWFEISLIPETLKRTTLGLRQPGETVNLEVDVIAKYVEKLAQGGAR
jgi:riboflavin synthase